MIKVRDMVSQIEELIRHPIQNQIGDQIDIEIIDTMYTKLHDPIWKQVDCDISHIIWRQIQHTSFN